MRFKNKVVIITGSSTGIGKAIATAFAKEGAKVVINNNSNIKEGEEVVKQIKSLDAKALYIQADVSKMKEITKLCETVIKNFGTIDILVNNAGIQIASPFENTTEAMWDSILDTNLKGVFNCIKAVLPYMKKQQKGKIISTASFTAFTGSLVSVPYGASKAGIVNMTKTLSKELGEYNITINAVAPGATNTNLLRGLDQKLIDKLVNETPLGRLAEPEDIAKSVLFFASSEVDFITGQTLVVDGGRM